MFPDEYLAEEKWVRLLKRTTEWVLFEPSRPHEPFYEPPR
jgi:hypothetical protein